MKKFTKKNEKTIETGFSIAGLVLAYITLNHNMDLLEVLVSIELPKAEYQNSRTTLIELFHTLIPLKYRKSIIHFHHKSFCRLAWLNFIFFLGGTIYTNILLDNHYLDHIDGIALLECIVLTLEKNPVQKFNRFLDFIKSLFK